MIEIMFAGPRNYGSILDYKLEALLIGATLIFSGTFFLIQYIQVNKKSINSINLQKRTSIKKLNYLVFSILCYTALISFIILFVL